MASREVFQSQLATYVAYHRDARNRATHFVGVPAIVFATLLALAQFDVVVAGQSFSLALAALAAFWTLWFVLDMGVGAAMGLFLVPAWLAAEWLADGFGPGVNWTIFGVAFVGGWAFQLVGHVYEGRRPALVDNLFQALIGPMFLVAEIFIALGLRSDLKAALDPQAQNADGGPAAAES